MPATSIDTPALLIDLHHAGERYIYRVSPTAGAALQDVLVLQLERGQLPLAVATQVAGEFSAALYQLYARLHGSGLVQLTAALGVPFPPADDPPPAQSPERQPLTNRLSVKGQRAAAASWVRRAAGWLRLRLLWADAPAEAADA